MADRLITAAGKFSLGIVGASPDVAVQTNPSSGVITSHTKGQFVLAAAGSATLPFPAGITNAQFLWFRTSDNVDGTPKEVTPTINATVHCKAVEFQVFNSSAPNIASISLLAGAGNSTLVEFVLAG